MPQTAVLMLDLQRDFLDRKQGRMPVDEAGAQAVIRVANQLMSRSGLGKALIILVTNQFPAAARVANFFRHGAAVRGTAGAELDPRLRRTGSELVITKSSPSAFTNPELERTLQAHGVQDIYVMGVFAEGCVRSTALDAVKHGYTVHVIANAVATNAPWKKAFALWSMARSGVAIVPSVVASSGSAARFAASDR